MTLTFINSAQELTYQRVVEYLNNSMFKPSLRVYDDRPRFDLLYQNATVIEVDVLPWEVHPWDDSELAIVRATSYVALGDGQIDQDIMKFLMGENRRMRFGAFQLDEAGHVLFSHSILGGESMDLRELQACLLSVAAIATSYSDVIEERFSGRQKSGVLLSTAQNVA
jgi:hypothetical protein